MHNLIKEAVVPGYLSTETRKCAKLAEHSRFPSQVLAMQGRYIQNLEGRADGRLPAGALGVLTDIPTPNDVQAPTLDPQSGVALGDLRTRVEEEDRRHRVRSSTTDSISGRMADFSRRGPLARPLRWTSLKP